MKAITIRFTDEQYEALKKASVKVNRSINNYVVESVKEKVVKTINKDSIGFADGGYPIMYDNCFSGSCDSCGSEFFKVDMSAFSRTVFNGDLAICPNCK